MTPPDSPPSALLERAAALIEHRASLAVIGPWATVGPRVTAGPDEDWRVADCTTSTTAAWIAMLAPPVAQPLVEWLRTAAFEFEEAAGPAEAAGEPVVNCVGSASRAALTFARQVLGEHP